MFNRVHGPESFPDNLRPAEGHADLPLELRELMQQQAGNVATAGPAADSDWPVSIYVPERYEENYAYPLLVWFHDTGHHEGQIESVMAAISPQNYCGLGIRGNLEISPPSAFGWSADLLEYETVSLRDLLSVTIRRVRRAFHIHSERIFLAGCGTGADVVLSQLCESPQWYAGGLVLDPVCGSAAQEALATGCLTSMPLLWTVCAAASGRHLAQNVEAVQRARLAGACPDVRVTEQRLNPETGDVRFMDRWLLARFGTGAWT